MAQYKRKPKKRKAKVKVSTNTRLKKKGENIDSLPKAPTETRVPSNGIVFRVKARRK